MILKLLISGIVQALGYIVDIKATGVGYFAIILLNNVRLILPVFIIADATTRKLKQKLNFLRVRFENIMSLDLNFYTFQFEFFGQLISRKNIMLKQEKKIGLKINSTSS